MPKHIYLYTSNLNHLRDLDEDRSFEHVWNYDQISLSKTHQNEYGKVKTKKNYYHIFVGRMRQKNCPWCNSQCEPNRIEKSDFCASYYMQCKNCGARGPVLSIASGKENDKDSMDLFINLLLNTFETRRPWDADLNIDENLM